MRPQLRELLVIEPVARLRRQRRKDDENSRGREKCAEAALAARPDRILLDDFDDHTLRKAVELAGGRVPLEVSGGITLERLPAIAQTGVDCISIGSLTKHVRAIDFSMRVDAGFRG